MAEQLSKSRIDKAGERLRQWALGDRDPGSLDTPELQGALEVLAAYRSMHTSPLRVVQDALARAVADEVASAPAPTGRSKRGGAIVAKLVSLPDHAALADGAKVQELSCFVSPWGPCRTATPR